MWLDRWFGEKAEGAGIDQAQRVVTAYGGFMEWTLFRLKTVFLAGVPQSLLPFPPDEIEKALNTVAEYHDNAGNRARVNALRECQACLGWFGDDEECMLAADTSFQKKEFRDLMGEQVAGCQMRHSAHVDSYFRDKPLGAADLENPDFHTAYKIVSVYSDYLKHAHMPLSFVFCDKIPESLLPFSREHLVKALDVCSVGDRKHAEVYAYGKTVLAEDYVANEVGIGQLILNLADKETRDDMTADMKDYHDRDRIVGTVADMHKESQMGTNRILDFIISVLSLFIVPVQLVTTFILGILVTCSFGLLLVPISLIWVVLIFPLVGGSWLCSKIEVLRNPVGLLGIPWALVAHIYACLMPSMGEFESRADKLLLTESWPFCWEYWQFRRGLLDTSSPEGKTLHMILERISRQDALKQRTLNRLSRQEVLDPNV